MVSRLIEQDWSRLYLALPFHPSRGQSELEYDVDRINKKFVSEFLPILIKLFECLLHACLLVNNFSLKLVYLRLLFMIGLRLCKIIASRLCMELGFTHLDICLEMQSIQCFTTVRTPLPKIADYRRTHGVTSLHLSKCNYVCICSMFNTHSMQYLKARNSLVNFNR